jgi:hypothetical protein
MPNKVHLNNAEEVKSRSEIGYANHLREGGALDLYLPQCDT